MTQKKSVHTALTRRELLVKGTAAALAAPFVSACGGRTQTTAGANGVATESPFKHGIASGDPLTDRVILWTRVTPLSLDDGDIPVLVTLADDHNFSRNVVSYASAAVRARDWTVKVDFAGLSPGQTYYYRFEALGQVSPAGRTQTASLDPDQLRFAVVSCSNFPAGYFNAYRFIAERDDLDMVLHLGDYLYEYGGGEGDRTHEPPHEILTLEDYRTRHAQYKGDPDLAAAHAAHPWITVWDDHESTNNSRRDSAQNHSEGDEGVWAVRKAWAQQAYDEWMPIRLPEPGNPNRIWRRFQFGSLLDLWMLDTRLYDRDDEAAFFSPDVFDPTRRLIGPEQQQWLFEGLRTTNATWKVLGQQVMFGPLKATPLPDIDLPLGALGDLPIPILGDGEGVRDVYVNPDQWDGYQAERDAILEHLRRYEIDNTVVLTGDIHSSWVMDLPRDPDNLLEYNALTGAGSLGVEFVATSVTSTGFDQVPGLTQLPQLLMAIRAANPHMQYIEGTRRGYLVMDVTHEKTSGEYWYVSTITERGGDQELAASYSVLAGTNAISRDAG